MIKISPRKLFLFFISAIFLASFIVTPIRIARAEDLKCDTDFYARNDILFYNPCEQSCFGNTGGALVGADNKEKIWNWLIAKGMTPMGAAGIMGNMNNESGFNPFRFQGSATNEEIWQYDGNRLGYNGNAWGLVQWDGPRRVSSSNEQGTTGVLDQIRINHPDWVKFIDKKYGDSAESYTVAEQEQPGITNQFIDFSLEFMYFEATPGGNRSTVWEEVKAATTVLDATVIFHNKFEGSNDSPEQVATSRGAAAQDIYDTYNGSTPGAPSSSPQSTCESEEQPASQEFTYYSQLDPQWRDTKLKDTGNANEGGSFGADGCGPTADAMVVATLLGDKNITPVTIAELANKHQLIGGSGPSSNGSYGLSGNSEFRFVLEATYGLKSTDIGDDINAIAEFVKGGGYVIMSGTSGEGNDDQKTREGPFSAGGHYVVVKSVTADGKLVIANPYSVNGGPAFTPEAGHPQPWDAEQTFEASHFDSLNITGAYGFKKA